ncbi:MAG: hypothetical protein P4L99_28440 [Chthoniobacter sp.]|nr:hypothetical protein [Chthoniobacter sp.]
MTNPVGAAAAAPSFTARPSAARSALLGVMFLAAFVTTCVLLRRSLPFPEVPVVRAKLGHLARHGDEYDVLFVGSSRVQFQVMPVVFDHVSGENGVPVKSFNAGVAGMGSPEDAYLLEEILRRPHARLRWVFVELSRLGTGLDREATARFSYWHDATRLELIARRLWGQASEEQAKLERNQAAAFGARYEIWSTMADKLSGHGWHWLRRSVNLGAGTRTVDFWQRTRADRRHGERDLGDHRDGWVSAGHDHQQMGPEARLKYEQSYAERMLKPAGKERGDEVSRAALEQLVATITQAGAVPILVIPPTTFDQNFFPTEERERELEIFDFTDVRENAELFAPDRRIDVDHVNTAGAELFSTALARRFVELVKQTTKTP